MMESRHRKPLSKRLRCKLSMLSNLVRGRHAGTGAIPLREAMGIDDADLAATCLRGARYREGLTQQQLSDMSSSPANAVVRISRLFLEMA